MNAGCLTIKELTDAVGGGLTPRMVRHYHQLGLLPQPVRSHSNYRLYTKKDVLRLQRIVALKQQGFQLNHIRNILEVEPEADTTVNLMGQLQQQYRAVMQQISQLRQTASALEGLLGRDRHCQIIQAEVLAQLKLLDVETQAGLGGLENLWSGLDAEIHTHSEAFSESLQRLLPDLSNRSEIEQHLISQLVLACGDVSLVSFVKLSRGAIAASREALSSSCQIVVDTQTVAAALDQTRLLHLGCRTETLIDNPHITTATEAEAAFWQHRQWREKLLQVNHGCVLVIGYAPSVLVEVCEAIANQKIQPALVIGMPIGFSHAPAAKRQLMQQGIPFITVEGTLGGGALAATALNALVESLIDKPDCHCYLKNIVDSSEC
ncbi:MerR family transcriptional regulator [Nostoc sp. 'Peltigera membranacea cyanobiont' 213]|uniref:precorrin-8X methylmutase n=1 Tax=Nostoc cyanobionts TaxID=3123326 RepID=UPI000B959AF5|nr:MULTISPECIES: precorrin-8X methylmutase [unclassified Nostoc]AVH67054.1 precorrin-8X/cobalt-precorrin-8 methylmutase [Nostoc sp. 'Peltigera membranacea cyanobiont' N6]OYD95924.1 MerR family transcriptional regulator [Nostoc sp. 'Peltigera membranacea cyanobiont' 213]